MKIWTTYSVAFVIALSNSLFSAFAAGDYSSLQFLYESTFLNTKTNDIRDEQTGITVDATIRWGRLL